MASCVGGSIRNGIQPLRCFFLLLMTMAIGAAILKMPLVTVGLAVLIQNRIRNAF